MAEKVIKKIDLGNGDYGVFTVDKSILLDFCYPVGSIYITSNLAFDPQTAFGGGTWRVIEGFLKGKSHSINNIQQNEVNFLEETGGASSFTLDASNVPLAAHNHYIPLQWNNASSKGFFQVQSDGHPVYYQFKSNAATDMDRKAFDFGIAAGGKQFTGYVGVTIGKNGTTATASKTDSVEIPTEPPYHSVIIWERIA